MVPVKIECECGQHYAFDVEPVNGRMANRVTCPICGLDGTDMANEKIAGTLALSGMTAPVVVTPPPPPPVPYRPQVASLASPAESSEPVMAAPKSGLHLSGEMTAPGHVSTVEATAPAIAKVPKRGTYSADQLGLVSREQAALEAKAKISWGESPDSVVKYLMMQSYSYQEASDLVAEYSKERLGDLRKKGIGKIIQGIVLMCIPAVWLLLGLLWISMILTGILCMGGVFGFYLLITGIIMAVAPKMESGDVAED